MNIIICGWESTESGTESGTERRSEKVKELQQFLQDKGYEARCLNRDLNSRNLDQIPGEELENLKKADIMILIPPISTSDADSALKTYYKFALESKPVLIYVHNAHSELDSMFSLTGKVCRDKQELLRSLEELEEPEEVEITPKVLGVISNAYGDHEAEFEYNNFKCICPVTGERDMATLRITYAPHEWLLEYESLDRYFNQFIDKKIHHEGVVNEVFHHLQNTLHPKWIKVVAEFEPRSGVKATIKKRSE